MRYLMRTSCSPRLDVDVASAALDGVEERGVDQLDDRALVRVMVSSERPPRRRRRPAPAGCGSPRSPRRARAGRFRLLQQLLDGRRRAHLDLHRLAEQHLELVERRTSVGSAITTTMRPPCCARARSGSAASGRRGRGGRGRFWMRKFRRRRIPGRSLGQSRPRVSSPLGRLGAAPRASPPGGAVEARTGRGRRSAAARRVRSPASGWVAPCRSRVVSVDVYLPSRSALTWTGRRTSAGRWRSADGDETPMTISMIGSTSDSSAARGSRPLVEIVGDAVQHLVERARGLAHLDHVDRHVRERRRCAPGRREATCPGARRRSPARAGRRRWRCRPRR